MKKIVRGAWLVMALILMTGMALAQEIQSPIATQAPIESRVYQLGNHKIMIPEDWTLVRNAAGLPQVQFLDEEGKKGVCMISIFQLKSADTAPTLESVGKALGATESVTVSLGQRNVLVYDTTQGTQTTTNVLVLDGRDAIVTQVYILDAVDTARQRTVGLQIAKDLDPKQ